MTDPVFRRLIVLAAKKRLPAILSAVGCLLFFSLCLWGGSNLLQLWTGSENAIYAWLIAAAVPCDLLLFLVLLAFMFLADEDQDGCREHHRRGPPPPSEQWTWQASLFVLSPLLAIGAKATLFLFPFQTVTTPIFLLLLLDAGAFLVSISAAGFTVIMFFDEILSEARTASRHARRLVEEEIIAAATPVPRPSKSSKLRL